MALLVKCQDRPTLRVSRSRSQQLEGPKAVSSCDDNQYKTFDICGVCGGDGSSCRVQRQGQVGNAGSRSRSWLSKFKWRRVWTPCSVSCGVGQRRLDVICVNTHSNKTEREHRCEQHSKPSVEITSCVEPSCSYSDIESDGPVGDDIFSIFLGDLFSEQPPAIPKFYSGDWAPCSVTCGEGSRTRQVTCNLNNTFTKQEDTLADAKCFGTKPIAEEVCNEGPCPGDLPSIDNLEPTENGSFYKWHIGKFSPCSRSCLEGVQESQLSCVLVSDEKQMVSPSLCSKLKKPALHVQPCNLGPCPPRWEVGDYGECSVACGGGVMRRPVRCVQDQADDSAREVDNFRCPDPVPDSKMTCNNIYCPAIWTFDPWEKAENYTFIQLRRAKKVKLPVGGKLVLLPGQSITVRCPVKNFHRRLIFWSKGTKLISMVGRVRASFNGNLKIHKADPASDGGTYTCIAGSETADVTIDFLSKKEAHRKMKDVRQYLRNSEEQSTVVVNPGEPRYEDGVFQDGRYNVTKKFVYMADDWFPCSVTCGSGHQKRTVTCMRVTNKYMKIFPTRECEKLGLEKPQEIRKCFPLADCPHWIVGNWSKCSLETCVRDGYAERRRELQCAYSNGTSALKEVCSGKGNPPETSRECVNIDCVSHWDTSPWTACRPSCGLEGRKMRMLTCAWRKTDLPAWNACRDKARPVASKVCKIRPCPADAGCTDESRYCSLARMLKMCRYNDFQRKCCKSCTTYLQSTLP